MRGRRARRGDARQQHCDDPAKGVGCDQMWDYSRTTRQVAGGVYSADGVLCWRALASADMCWLAVAWASALTRAQV